MPLSCPVPESHCVPARHSPRPTQTPRRILLTSLATAVLVDSRCHSDCTASYIWIYKWFQLLQGIAYQSFRLFRPVWLKNYDDGSTQCVMIHLLDIVGTMFLISKPTTFRKFAPFIHGVKQCYSVGSLH